MKKQTEKKTQKDASLKKEDQFGVVLEDMHSKIGLILEGYSALDSKIDRNHIEFQDFEKGVESNFQSIFHYLSRIEDGKGVRSLS